VEADGEAVESTRGKKGQDMSFTGCFTNAVRAGNPVLASTILMNAPMTAEVSTTFAALAPKIFHMEFKFGEDMWADISDKCTSLEKTIADKDESKFLEVKTELAAMIGKGRFGNPLLVPPRGTAVVFDDEEFCHEMAKDGIEGTGGRVVRSYQNPARFIEDFQNFEIDVTQVFAFFVDQNYDEAWDRDGLHLARMMKSWGVSSAIYMSSSHFRTIGGESHLNEALKGAGIALGIPKFVHIDKTDVKRMLGLHFENDWE
jgi:hypothetical protein